MEPGRRVTYRELGELVDASARAMMASGVEHGDRIAIWAPNGLGWIVAAVDFFGYKKPKPSSPNPPSVNERSAGRPPEPKSAGWQGPPKVNAGWAHIFGRWPDETDPVAPRPTVSRDGGNFNPFNGRWS